LKNIAQIADIASFGCRKVVVFDFFIPTLSSYRSTNNIHENGAFISASITIC
jgi:hypothetical protein